MCGKVSRMATAGADTLTVCGLLFLVRDRANVHVASREVDLGPRHLGNLVAALTGEQHQPDRGPKRPADSLGGLPNGLDLGVT
jgi:hypothetical protein